jgi:hypothetical protein
MSSDRRFQARTSMSRPSTTTAELRLPRIDPRKRLSSCSSTLRSRSSELAVSSSSLVDRKLLVHRLELLVGRLELLDGGLQLLVGALELAPRALELVAQRLAPADVHEGDPDAARRVELQRPEHDVQVLVGAGRGRERDLADGRSAPGDGHLLEQRAQIDGAVGDDEVLERSSGAVRTGGEQVADCRFSAITVPSASRTICATGDSSKPALSRPDDPAGSEERGCSAAAIGARSPPPRRLRKMQ